MITISECWAYKVLFYSGKTWAIFSHLKAQHCQQFKRSIKIKAMLTEKQIKNALRKQKHSVNTLDFSTESDLTFVGLARYFVAQIFLFSVVSWETILPNFKERVTPPPNTHIHTHTHTHTHAHRATLPHTYCLYLSNIHLSHGYIQVHFQCTNQSFSPYIIWNLVYFWCHSLHHLEEKKKGVLKSKSFIIYYKTVTDFHPQIKSYILLCILTPPPVTQNMDTVISSL